MYDSPITLFETFDTVINVATKKHNKTVMAEIQSNINIDIDEKALTQALIQDKERYQEAYRRGYEDGKYYGVKHGHWINDGYACGDTQWTCSVCGEYEFRAGKRPYCCNCGAKMDEEIEYDR